MSLPIKLELTLTPESADALARLAAAYGPSLSDMARGGSRMSESRAVSGQIDDDFLRRLMDAIDDACGVHDVDRPPEQLVAECIDGDLFLAYQETRAMFAAAYPDLYEDEQGH